MSLFCPDAVGLSRIPGAVEVESTAVPQLRLGHIAPHITQARTLEESWIECRAEAHRAPTISGIGGALVKQSC